MHYSICRIVKIKSYSELSAVSAHNSRLHYTDNADPAKRHLNKCLVGSSDIVHDLKKLYQEKNIAKLRKNGVLAVEMILAFSHEWIKDGKNYRTDASEKVKSWVKASLHWAKNKFGDNVVSCTYHGDETSPHLHLVLGVSYHDEKRMCWKLSADHFFGSKAKLVELQTSCAQSVASLGLKRGVRGSKASHQTLKQFYSQVNKAAEVSISRGINPPDRAPQAFAEWEDLLAQNLEEKTEQEELFLAEIEYWKTRYMHAVGQSPKPQLPKPRITRH